MVDPMAIVRHARSVVHSDLCKAQNKEWMLEGKLREAAADLNTATYERKALEVRRDELDSVIAAETERRNLQLRDAGK